MWALLCLHGPGCFLVEEVIDLGGHLINLPKARLIVTCATGSYNSTEIYKCI
jgi:hypothetical protein